MVNSIQAAKLGILCLFGGYGFLFGEFGKNGNNLLNLIGTKKSGHKIFLSDVCLRIVQVFLFLWKFKK